MEKFDFKKVFLESIKKEFSFLKEETNFCDTAAKSITLSKNFGALFPINYSHMQDDFLISLLTKWREENAFAYPTKFKVTVDGTKKWLKEQVLDNPSRILFLVVDKQGKWIGHVGLAD